MSTCLAGVRPSVCPSERAWLSWCWCSLVHWPTASVTSLLNPHPISHTSAIERAMQHIVRRCFTWLRPDPGPLFGVAMTNDDHDAGEEAQIHLMSCLWWISDWRGYFEERAQMSACVVFDLINRQLFDGGMLVPWWPWFPRRRPVWPEWRTYYVSSHGMEMGSSGTHH